MYTELHFLKPHNVAEIAEATGQDVEYLKGLLHESGGKTVTLQINHANVPEGFMRAGR